MWLGRLVALNCGSIANRVAFAHAYSLPYSTPRSSGVNIDKSLFDTQIHDSGLHERSEV